MGRPVRVSSARRGARPGPLRRLASDLAYLCVRQVRRVGRYEISTFGAAICCGIVSPPYLGLVLTREMKFESAQHPARRKIFPFHCYRNNELHP